MVLSSNRVYSLYVDGICLKNNKILLVKRNCEPFKGFWHVVGGEVQKHESIGAALRREFKEETALDIEVGDIIGSRVEESFDRTKLILILEVASFNGEIKLNSENESFGWFTKFPSHSVSDYSDYLK